MDYTAKTTSVDKESTDCAVVGIFKPKRLSDSAKKLDKLYRGNISSACKRGIAGGDLGQITTLHNSARSKHNCIILVGCGEQDELTISAFQKVLAEIANEIKRNKISNLINCVSELPVKNADVLTKTQLSVTTIESAMYQFSET
ncbi:MAG: M17 family peptidase N-terminal domain-containing protein [Gammaproteobacteria bacterium]